MGEALKSRMRAGDDEVRRMLEDIAGCSRQLITDMGDIVWSLDPRRDQIGELASRLRAFGSGMLETRGVDISMNWTADIGDGTVVEERRRAAELLRQVSAR